MSVLYLIRHGVTQPNIDGYVSGSGDDIALVPQGIRQSRAAGEWLRKQKINRVFASPMLRVRQTVQAMNLHLTTVFDARLREAGWGIFEKTPSKDVPDEFRWPNLFRHPDLRRPRGESFNDMRQRLESFRQEYLPVHNDVCAIVAHGGTIRVMLTLLCPQYAAHIVENEHTGNAEIWRVEGGRCQKVFSPSDVV